MIFTDSSHLRSPVTGLLLVLSIMFGAATAAAQPDQSGASAMRGGQSAQQIQQTRQKIQQLSAELQTIQQKTLAANPELKEQSEDFQALLDQQMSANGFEAQKTRERLNSIRDEFKNGDVSQQEKQALAQEFQTKRRELGQARRKAMSSEDVKAARTSLNQDLVAAMTEQNPKTKQLLAELNKAKQQYSRMMQQMMRQQAGGDQGR